VTITNLSFLLAVLSLAVPLAGEAQQTGSPVSRERR
jgi:hypothetical protein